MYTNFDKKMLSLTKKSPIYSSWIVAMVQIVSRIMKTITQLINERKYHVKDDSSSTHDKLSMIMSGMPKKERWRIQ